MFKTIFITVCCYNYSILLLAILNHILCLICKLNFVTGVCVEYYTHSHLLNNGLTLDFSSLQWCENTYHWWVKCVECTSNLQ